MQYEISNCKSCKKKTAIINRKHWLCNDCNYFRINGKKRETKPLKRTPLKRSTVKIKVSSKQKESLKELKKLYKEMEVDELLKFCFCCGVQTNLQHSHLIARSRSKKLEAVPLNIVWMCGECHEVYETHSPAIWEQKGLKNIPRLLERIKVLDYSYYVKLKNKM